MSYLLDTNILLRSIDLKHPMNAVTVTAIEHLISADEELIIAPQNLIELWNVMTRPVAKNGLGKTQSEAKVETEKFTTTFTLLPDLPEIYPTWSQLATDYQVQGINVHDTRLVAFMLVHNISHILTFNTKDFRRFNQEITSVHPDSVDV
ncbi:MAG: type II toxin-antitoxin system VapC family toxin [Xenococcus sp. MO_188.B8]|nr:type II toxin-antitoxin system VapC family toxin [Xenococcus sp. MO_188.B8]